MKKIIKKPRFLKQEQSNIFEERIRYIKIIFFICFLGIFFKLFNLQVIEYSKNAIIDKKTKFARIKILPERGKIFDRNGKLLAFNFPNYSLYFDTWVIKKLRTEKPEYLDELKNTLFEILKIDKKEIEEKMNGSYCLIKKNLEIEEYEKIKKLKLKGIYFEKGYKRIYPYGKHACHILGYTNVDGKGIEGVEYFYNSFLKGKEGIYMVLKDGLGNFIPSIRKKLIKEEKGKDIVLTIDSNIQFIVEEEIKNGFEKFTPKNISVIVMDPNTGEILALANYPDYDPNNFSKFDLSIIRNKCVTDLFEPGSIFKIVTAASAIEENLFTPSSTIMCEYGKWFVRGHYIHDVHPYGVLTFEDTLAKSSNIGIVKIAMALGEEKLYEYCKKFKFGERTGIDLPGEIGGIFRPLEQWSSYSITAIPFGQEVGITSVQGIRAISVFANGGYLVKPHILKEIKDEERNYVINNYINEKQQILSPQTTYILREILKKVVSEEGTASSAKIDGYNIYGKTGTSQKAIGGVYLKGKYVSSFVGFLLSKKKNIAITVNVDEPVGVYYGGLVAAPIFRDIISRIINYYQIPPEKDLKIVYKNEIKGTN
ncbi:MAG: penicillin-binding protein 2 [Candidatus Omnitrophica bacterium]|nr:penicillin-binding protein 2 [Candidatus Omnitrophota bacterium]MCM8802210.1 penicillin-binding protein 2 [Candidatus Omnitrophota bacterium]